MVSGLVTTDQWLAAAKHRRTVYGLKGTSSVPDSRVEEIVQQVLSFAPSSYNTQPIRVTIITGEKHAQLWDVIIAAAEPILKGAGEEVWAAMNGRFQGLKASYGTVAFWESGSSIKEAAETHQSAAHMFAEFASHTSGLHQILVWTALELEGLGANLQHLNAIPPVEAAFKKFAGVPDDYKLTAHLNYGDEAQDHPAVPQNTCTACFGLTQPTKHVHRLIRPNSANRARAPPDFLPRTFHFPSHLHHIEHFRTKASGMSSPPPPPAVGSPPPPASLVAAPDMSDGRLGASLRQLNTLESFLADAHNSVLQAWQRVRDDFNAQQSPLYQAVAATATAQLSDFVFASWSTTRVSPPVLSFVCLELHEQNIRDLHRSSRSRLRSIARHFAIPDTVCFLLLGHHASNNSVLDALTTLRSQCPNVTWTDFCHQAYTLSVSSLQGNPQATSARLVRETIQSFGDQIWPRRSTRNAPRSEVLGVTASNDDEAEQIDFDDASNTAPHYDPVPPRSRPPTPMDSYGRSRNATPLESRPPSSTSNVGETDAATVNEGPKTHGATRAASVQLGDDRLGSPHPLRPTTTPNSPLYDSPPPIEIGRGARGPLGDRSSVCDVDDDFSFALHKEDSLPIPTSCAFDSTDDEDRSQRRLSDAAIAYRRDPKLAVCRADFTSAIDASCPVDHVKRSAATLASIIPGPQVDVEGASKRQRPNSDAIATSSASDALPSTGEAVSWRRLPSRPIASLEQNLATAHACLSPQTYLNDIAVNTAISRLASQNVGVLDSLCLESLASRSQLAHLLRNKFTVLMPACDKAANHWRLYCWTAPSTLELFDPCKGLQDTTTPIVESLFASAASSSDISVIRAKCPQQENAYDCGVLVVEFARSLAAGARYPTLHAHTTSISLRTHLAQTLLTAERATLPAWSPSGMTVHATLLAHWKRSNLRHQLAQHAFSLPGNAFHDSQPLEQALMGLDLLQWTFYNLHNRHRSLLHEATQLEVRVRSTVLSTSGAFAGLDLLQEFCRIRRTIAMAQPAVEERHMLATEVTVGYHVKALEEQLVVQERSARDQVAALFGQCVALIVILRKGRVKYDMLQSTLC
ncbi:hypothetical protein G7046_g1205 [Stylonectria norvegica]|nr:hypothetical protein G7046_g1205 [Stylonectria norvegica]